MFRRCCWAAAVPTASGETPKIPAGSLICKTRGRAIGDSGSMHQCASPTFQTSLSQMPLVLGGVIADGTDLFPPPWPRHRARTADHSTRVNACPSSKDYQPHADMMRSCLMAQTLAGSFHACGDGGPGGSRPERVASSSLDRYRPVPAVEWPMPWIMEQSFRMTATLIMTLVGVFAASVLRGFTGFGFGLAAVPLLSLVLPPAKVVPFVVTLQVIVGGAGLRAAVRQCDWRAVRGLAPGRVGGIPIGVSLLTAFPANPVRLAIGLTMAGSVLLLWRGARLSNRPSAVLSAVTGLASGVISGLASMGGPPIVVYLLALGHEAAMVRATSITVFMLSGCLSMALMLMRGLIDQEIAFWSIVAVPALLAGSWLGSWGFAYARPYHHRLTALVVLSVLAMALIARSLAL
jgi:uncharacterized membrane protein YfcA